MAFRNLPEMPCGPILELHGQRKRFHVPFGLKRLIEEMTREVLRFQPENIYEFLADFMDSRLKRRLTDEDKNRKSKGGSILDEDLEGFLDTLPAPVEQVNHHATVIQAAFRGYQARKKVKEIRKSVQVDLEQIKAIAAAQDEEHEEEEDEEEGWEEGQSKNRRNTMTLNDTNATEEELHSAVILQAAFRGMHARNKVKKLRASLVEKRKTKTGLDENSDSLQQEKVADVPPEQTETESPDASQPENNATTAGNDESSQGVPKAPTMEEESQDRNDSQSKLSISEAPAPDGDGNSKISQAEKT